ncbi:jg24953 [Pararge aegeria aegeria]|uniref:Jg24953 protein n=1 Tax=Pararge aegeria aegeria TaxID=348720 RepID=A0A8S4QNZ7_9NEOP|nr:jg24953 [Pararge aegeria aegeria]
MARKGQVTIQETVETNEEFEETLKNYYNILICLEVYSEYCGYCLATGNAIRKAKLEIGQDRIYMVKVKT